MCVFELTYPSASHRRGLNPPHRVKSISMTTFTAQEIEFLQKHSNEVAASFPAQQLCPCTFCWVVYLSFYWHSSPRCTMTPTHFRSSLPPSLTVLSPTSPGFTSSPIPNSLSPILLTPPLTPLQVCKHIWLGLYDDRTSVVPDFREPQKVKEFLQEKYEKKRW